MTDLPEDAKAVIGLPDLLDLTAAEPLHRVLLDHLLAGDSLCLGGAAVQRVSTAAVQVMLSAAAEARLRGAAFQLLEPSTVLRAALADLGVAAAFGV